MRKKLYTSYNEHENSHGYMFFDIIRPEEMPEIGDFYNNETIAEIKTFKLDNLQNRNAFQKEYTAYKLILENGESEYIAIENGLED